MIFTNQRGVSKGTFSQHELLGRFQAVSNSVQVPVGFWAAGLYNRWRKPGVGMWDSMMAECFVEEEGKGKENGESVDGDGGKKKKWEGRIDLGKCFYVGDAAGRCKSGVRRKKDWSDSDKKFAINIGIEFYTPEEFFEGRKKGSEKFVLSGFNPRKDLVLGDDQGGKDIIFGGDDKDMKEVFKGIIRPKEVGESLLEEIENERQCLVLLVGFPASGKSTMTQRFLEPFGFVRVNNDTLRSKARCLKLTRDSLQEGRSVVVDNTNPRPDSRKPYIDIALAHNPEMPIFCIVMDTSREIAEHLNVYRSRITNDPNLHIPTVAYHTFALHFTEPTLKEGITKIGKAKFMPQFLTYDHYKEFLQLS